MPEQQAGQQHTDGRTHGCAGDADVSNQVAEADDQEQQQQPVAVQQLVDLDFHVRLILSGLRFFVVTAELEAHGREYLVGEIGLAA